MNNPVWMLALVAAELASGQRVLYLRSQTDVVDCAMSVDQSGFRTALLEDEGRRFLEKYKTFSLKRLVMYADPSVEVKFRLGKAMSHPTYYDSALRLKQREPFPAMAEIIGMPIGAVFRARMPDQSLFKKVLQGEDPLDLGGGPDFKAEIVYAHVGAVGFDSRQFLLSLFIRAHGPIDSLRARRIAESLWQQFPSTETSITIRHDDWFINSVVYPWRNPLIKSYAMPSEEAFLRSSEYFCSSYDSRQCVLWRTQ